MAQQRADLILTNGRVLTVDKEFTVASALAVDGDRVLAVGSDDEIRTSAHESTRVIDLEGRTVLPGINDAHLHLSFLGLAMPPHVIDLSQRNGNLATLQQRLAAAVNPDEPGCWLIGEGWNEGDIAEFTSRSRTPHRRDLDPHSGGHPVALRHFSYHAVWANTEALRLTGITKDTPDPEGGIIVRDTEGVPTGVLLESAGELLARRIPRPTARQRQDALGAGMQLLNSYGITSVTDPIVTPEGLRDYIALHQAGKLTVRVNALMHWDWPSTSSSVESVTAGLSASGLASGLGDPWLRIGGVKVFSDGVPSQGTAWTYQPDHHNCTGSLITAGHDDSSRYDELLDIIEVVHRNRMHVQVHATGDRAADAVIDGVIRAQERDPWAGARHAVLHGTMINDPNSIQRLADNGISVVTSSVMKAALGTAMRPALGDDGWEATFLAGSLLAAGVHVADSSDAPVVAPDWRQGLHAVVNGDEYGARAAIERLTVEQAIRRWTTAGAYLEDAADIKGSLEHGKLADFVIIGEDITAVADADLADLTPMLTYVGGHPVFDRTR